MKYLETLQAVDPVKALKGMGLESTQQGAYLHFKCVCGKTASLKAYGIKKNLWYCNHCKRGGHIISLAMALKGIEWEGSKEFLKKYMFPTARITAPLNFRYELQYTDILEKKGITKEFAQVLGIGKPKGHTMLAGCIAFEIRQNGDVVAYYGIRIANGCPVFHHSFNPELYLYGIENTFPKEPVQLTRDMFECARLITENVPVVCNFGLPYLSQEQLRLLHSYQSISFRKDEESGEIIKQLFEVGTFAKIQ